MLIFLLFCISLTKAAFQMDEITRAAAKAEANMAHPPKELMEVAHMIAENHEIPKPMLLKAGTQARVVMKGKRSL